jgi:hypothetical protein
MTAWAVVEVLRVGIGVLLLAWTSLMYVPFRWRPVGLYLWIPKLAAELVEQAVATATAKRPLPAVGRVRLERWREGRVAQLLHLGPYSAEGPTIERLHGFIADQGLARRGKHHEPYLSAPSRTAPERLRTVIRSPVTD